MPLAYKLMIISSKPPANRRAPLGSSAEANVPARSRGASTSTVPT